ncbi:GTP cyclohydrolase, FolE2/MptA family [Fluviispira multicolorata]|uniref:Uncharacterized protein n=1 Tax=Fluviispira multicolorata TaxID=2654512 RepID=A0A833JDN9_9BACT|nr:GTP cyclohydrolase, FolE2/MptA family [Fluviispira multicolorata]KAB8031980.1 hypothetical protein GCL57_04860 [Fluviispira multicolorata]
MTEKAYNNLRFVEYLARKVALILKNKCPHSRFEVSSENFEFIHKQNAYAFICSDDLS